MILLSRGLYSTAPPEPRTKASNNPTLLFSWWCTGFALAIIFVRLGGRMVRNNQLFREDKIMLLSILPLLARMALVHVILIWGTNNVDVSGGLTAIQIQHRTVGSKLVLASRICYAMFIWMAKFTISEFLKRLTSSFWKREYQVVLHAIRIFLVATFIAVVIATLAECQPFDHYWQVVPDPGPRCRLGYAQLITMGTADMVTDVLLIFFPIPIVLRAKVFNLKRKISLVLLFSLSAILVVVTGFRVKSVIAHAGRQQYRSVWASGEILAAAAVSNAIVIGSFLRDRGVKKQKYKYNSSTGSTERPSVRRHTLTLNNNHSDESLFRDMCYRTAPELEEQWVPRPPPMAALSPTATRRESGGSKAHEGYFPESTAAGSNCDSEDSDIKTAIEAPIASPPPSPRETRTGPSRKRNVSFCDVGGLLEDASSRSSTIAPSPTMTTSQDFAAGSPSARRGSRQILSELGGLLSPIRSSRRRSSQENMPDMQENSMTSALPPSPSREHVTPVLKTRHESAGALQDIGGLLGASPEPSTPRAPPPSYTHASSYAQASSSTISPP